MSDLDQAACHVERPMYVSESARGLNTLSQMQHLNATCATLPYDQNNKQAACRVPITTRAARHALPGNVAQE